MLVYKSLNVTATPTHCKKIEIFPVNVAADLDVPVHEYVRTCLLGSLLIVHILGLFCSLNIEKTVRTHL